VTPQHDGGAPLAPLPLLPLTAPPLLPPPPLPPPLFAPATHCRRSFAELALRLDGKEFGRCKRTLLGRSALDVAAFYYNWKSVHNPAVARWKDTARNVSSVAVFAAERLLLACQSLVTGAGVGASVLALSTNADAHILRIQKWAHAQV
jgi:hypothetical protein